MAIEFTCDALLPQSAAEIMAAILDLSQWPDFAGYGPLPGIASAEWDHRTAEVAGSRIRVVNRDGTRHVEEILEWAPPQRLAMRLCDFSPPVRWLAREFVETWEFTPAAVGTQVRRTLTLRPRSPLAWPVLRLIAPLLRRAIERHLQQMKTARQTP